LSAARNTALADSPMENAITAANTAILVLLITDVLLC